MQYTISQLRQVLYENVYNVYEIFQNFFGERFTDLQGVSEDADLKLELENHSSVRRISSDCYEIPDSALRAVKRAYSSIKPVIMVWWPRVTVTNENDRSVVIYDLYARIEVTMEGRIPYENRGFELNRTTFPEIQFSSGYLHSHIPHFSGIPHFANPCLGSGPINNTILDLKNGYEETVWMLFCQELALYVTVESLKGGPYFSMESIGSSYEAHDYRGYSIQPVKLDVLCHYRMSAVTKQAFRKMVRDFTAYYLRNGHLSIGYKDGEFIQGMPYFDYMIDISNSFIDFYNSTPVYHFSVNDLYEFKILHKVLAANGKFYCLNDNSVHDYSAFEGSDMFRFKGEMKHLHIETDEQFHREETILLRQELAMLILHNIIKVINYRYTNEYNKQLGSTESTASSGKTVCYL